MPNYIKSTEKQTILYTHTPERQFILLPFLENLIFCPTKFREYYLNSLQVYKAAISDPALINIFAINISHM